MKRVLLSLLVFVPLSLLTAQNCEPDPAYADSIGVFPFPYDPVASPDGGITDCAVIGETFDFTFTVVVGDSITAEVFPGQPVTLPLTKVVVTSVENLPEGVSLLCEPANCEYAAGTMGCARLTGVPTAANTAGDYELVIKGTAFFPVLPFQYPLTFPGVLADGTYTLRLLADPSEPCNLVSTSNVLREKVSISSNPNPASGLINVEINAGLSGDFDLQLFDLLGQPVYHRSVLITEGLNRFGIDGNALPNGMYLLILKNEQGSLTRKITIQH